MNALIDKIKKIRVSLLDLLDDISLYQINKIPEGYNNNIAWNLGHLVAAQQGICYLRSGKKMRIGDSFYELYKKGSKPERDIPLEEFEEIKKLLFATLDSFESDMQHHLFNDFTPVITPYGVELKTIDEALSFLLFHEGLHYGYIMALKRVTK